MLGKPDIRIEECPAEDDADRHLVDLATVLCRELKDFDRSLWRGWHTRQRQECVEVGPDSGASSSDTHMFKLIAICIANACGERRLESSADATYLNRIVDYIERLRLTD